jgi:hypothetical protein
MVEASRTGSLTGPYVSVDIDVLDRLTRRVQSTGGEAG